MKRTITWMFGVLILAIALNVGGCGKSGSAAQGGTSFFPTATME